MKKIAVITACYNCEKYLSDCVASVAACFTNNEFTVEHILVDDCSTNDTKKLIEKLSGEGLQKIYLEKNSGQSVARNVAVKQTDADYLFVLDSDDVIFQNSLRYFFELAESKKLSWLFGDILLADNKLTYQLGEDFYGWVFPTVQDLLYSLYSGGHIFLQNCFYTRELFESVEGFDPELRMSEDFDLYTKFALKGVCPRFFPSPVYLRRIHGKNLTMEYTHDRSLHKVNVRKLYVKYSEQIQKVLAKDQLAEIQKYLSA